MTNLFAVILKYTVPIEIIEDCRPKHVVFLERYYQQGLFLVSGPQVPRTGGVIIARAPSKAALETILAEDPFAIQGLAEYSIYEFLVNKYADVLEDFLKSVENKT